jgi:SAM-dependent methyltransferase
MIKTIKSIGLGAILFLGFALSVCAQSDATEVKKDVPYVPTPQSVVDRMLEIAQVGADDIVYDLGCGDGRIVVTAARDRGARGVGIDIDPQRIRESNENARLAGVTDKVEFRVEDLFITDFSETTVLTLYLLPAVNMELRPKILSELKPGSRVVSHDFDMGEWEPDQSEMLDYSAIFFWVVPANVSGTWTLRQDEKEVQIILVQQFQKVHGWLQEDGKEVPLSEVSLQGDQIAFTVDQEVDGKLTPVVYRARVEGNRMTGDREVGGVPFSAEREEGTERPLDYGTVEAAPDEVSLPRSQII